MPQCGAAEYELIRSDRRTLAIQVKPDGRVLVRAPKRTSQRTIDAFVRERAEWIEKARQKLQAQNAASEAAGPVLTREQLKALAAQAVQTIPQRVAYYAQLAGVTYGRITIRAQRTRWGSCSTKGNLNFNCLLMLAPPEVLDSVVAHELCHRLEMNHSPRFYSEIRRIFPEYDRWHGWLKQNGAALLARLQQ